MTRIGVYFTDNTANTKNAMLFQKHKELSYTHTHTCTYKIPLSVKAETQTDIIRISGRVHQASVFFLILQ